MTLLISHFCHIFLRNLRQLHQVLTCSKRSNFSRTEVALNLQVVYTRNLKMQSVRDKNCTGIRGKISSKIASVNRPLRSNSNPYLHGACSFFNCAHEVALTMQLVFDSLKFPQWITAPSAYECTIHKYTVDEIRQSRRTNIAMIFL